MNRIHPIRNTRFLLVAVLAVLFSLGTSGQPAEDSGGSKRWQQKHRPTQVPGELLVKFKPSTRKLSKHGVLGKVSAQKIKDLDAQWTRVKVDRAESTENTIRTLANDPNVEFAQPNFIYYATAIPNDSFFYKQWGLKNISTFAGQDMGLPEAWDITTDCSATIVAVVDSGVNYDHPDLAANMWSSDSFPNHGYDFANSDDDPMDYNGHGTHVAGTIAAVGNNSIGVSGVCWKARLMAVRVLNAFGAGTTSDLISGINFAVDNGAKVINMSLGGANYDAALEAAMERASNAGVVIVVAAGNTGTNNDSSPFYPCNSTQGNLICVAALDQRYGLASFSNYGKTSVHVGAPGVNIYNLWPGTITTIDESLTKGWNIVGGGWALGAKGFPNGDGTMDYYNMLTNPANWGTAYANYANNADQRAYKTFDLSGTTAVALEIIGMVSTEADRDYFNISVKDTGGDPFSSGGTPLSSFSGYDPGGYMVYEFSHCLTATCSVGFQLTSDAGGTDFGVAIESISLVKVDLATPSQEMLSGTSMATPHVAGLAAMIMAYNPDYSAADVVNSIKLGGKSVNSLTNKTVTGKAASALGSLSYLKPPTEVTAVLLQK